MTPDLSVPAATDTWRALPEAKRARIEAAALEAFATHGYDGASLTRLVAALGIAKGSLYQYFGGKLGLFVHLLQEAARRKQAAVQPALPEGEHPLEQLRALYVRGLAFWRDEPRWAALPLRLAQPSQEPALAALHAQLDDAARAFLRERLAAGRAAGQVRDDLPLDALVAFVHATLAVGLRDLLLARAGVTLADLPDRPLAIDEATLIATVDHALAFVRGGADPC